MIRSKAIIPVGLVLGLLFQGIAFAAFPDVPSSNANYDAIVYVQSWGIVSGYPDGSFRPNQTINRAEFVKILVGAYESALLVENIDKNSPMSIPDVRPEHWFHHYVYSAFYNHVITGYPDGTFKPENSINFVEAAKILAIVDHIPQEPLEGTEWFPLAPVTGEVWYKTYVDYLAQGNVIPTSINSFDQKITRGEMAEMVYRLQTDVTNKPSKTYDELAQAKTSNAPQDWSPFHSSYFTLSFSVPSGFEVLEEQSGIAIAQSPFYERDIGDSNAFLSLGRYDTYNTRDGQIALYRKLLKNLRESKTTVDGTSFLTFRADDYGRFEGDSAGKVVVVFFDASRLEIIERPANSDQNFDPISIGEQILSTFRFSKN